MRGATPNRFNLRRDFLDHDEAVLPWALNENDAGWTVELALVALSRVEGALATG